jgi:hypothetical protein
MSGVDDTPYLYEFISRLRMDAPDADMALGSDGEATVTWHDGGVGRPITVIVREADLAAAVATIGGESRDMLWPSSTTDDAGFNLLLVHFEEVIATRDTSRPLRISSAGLIWPDRRREN